MKSEVLEFYSKVGKDKRLVQRLTELKENNKNVGTQEVIKGILLPYSKKLGYDFSEADLMDALTSKLSPAELEQVAGGIGGVTQIIGFIGALLANFVGVGNAPENPMDQVIVANQQGVAQNNGDAVIDNNNENGTVTATYRECAYKFKKDGDSYILTGVVQLTIADDIPTAYIPASVDGKPVREISKHAFYKMDDLCAVEFDGNDENLGVQTINPSTFGLCTSLQRVKLSPSVKTIRGNAFTGTHITNINLEHVQRIENYGLAGCYADELNLTSIRNEADLGANAFEGSKINHVILDANQRLNIPKNVEYVHVRQADGSFETLERQQYNERAKQQEVDDADEIEIFELDQHNGNAVMADFNAKDGTVTATYRGCTYEFELDGDSYVLTAANRITNDGVAYIPASLNGKPVREISNKAFSNMKNLRAVEFDGDDEKLGVQTINSSAFWACNNLQRVKLSPSVKTIKGNAFGFTNITNINLEHVQRIEDYGLVGCTADELNLTSIHNEADLGADAFEYSSINHVILDANQRLNIPANVKYVYVRQANGSFETLERQQYNERANQQKYHQKLDQHNSDAVITDFNDEDGTVTATYRGCTYEFKMHGDSYVLTYANRITNDGVAYIPASVNGVPVREIYHNAFQLERNLREVDFTSATNLEKIGSGAFIYCENLRKVNMTASIKTIADHAFEGVMNLQIDLKNVQSIGLQAFYTCRIDEIDLTSINNINRGALSGAVVNKIIINHILFPDLLKLFNVSNFSEVHDYNNIKVVEKYNHNVMSLDEYQQQMIN